MTRWQRMVAVSGGLAGIATAAVLAALMHDRTAESPEYDVVEDDGIHEIRDYPGLTVAETAIVADRREALDRGFRRLADYIGGKARAAEDRTKIAMTAPVLADRHDGKWRTRFVMPAARAAAGLPGPGAEVTIADIPARRVGVIEFVGRATDATLEEKERELRTWLSAKGVRMIGPSEHAFYNSPAVPPLLRRTEIMIPITR